MGGWSLSRSAARRRAEARRRLLADIGLTLIPLAGLAATVAALVALSGCGLVARAVLPPDAIAAIECARDSDGTDAAVVACYTVRGLPAPDDLT